MSTGERHRDRDVEAISAGRLKHLKRTQRHLAWIKAAVHFEQPAQEATCLDYLHEVEHVAGRIERLERGIDEAVQTVPARMWAVIDALQALRGIALVSAVTIVAEVGELSRFKAQPRLHGPYRKLLGRGKCQQQVVTAVGRELLGFVWAIGVAVEQRAPRSIAA